MNKTKVTPKDFFLWAGAMISLYVSVFSFISLFFDYINYAFPDALNYYVDPYSGSIRYEIASLIVMFPVFLLLMNFIRRDIASDSKKKDLWVRRWALFLTVFVAGATIVIDLITLINTFLGGDLSERFVLKVLVVLLVMSVGLMHFLADIWGYWSIYPNRARSIGAATGIAVLLSIVAGFFIIGTPGQIRLYRFDDQKVNDLTTIQYQIVNYWQQKQQLPHTLSDLNDGINGFVMPIDPQSSVPYTYQTIATTTFKLCANFNAPSQSDSSTNYPHPMAVAPTPVGSTGVDLMSDSWYHSTGESCFVRTIDPARYPPLTKQITQ